MTSREAATDLPNSSIRTTISVLLMIHFAFILIAVQRNFLQPSEFRMRLARFPFATAYAQLFSQDIGYTGRISSFALTDGPFTVDHPCRVLLEWSDGIENDPEALAELEQLQLPPSGTWPGTRRERYLQLGRMAALNNDSPTTESLLPEAIVNYLLSQADGLEPTVGSRHRFQCNRRRLQDLPNLVSSDPDERNPLSEFWLSPGYDADVIGTGEGWAFSKVASRGEVTQVQEEVARPPRDNPTPPNGSREDR